MADNNDNINDTVNTVIGRKSNGQFQKGMKRPENAGRKKGTPNRKTRELLELLGDYDPAMSLLDILNSERIPVDLRVKIHMDLMSYVYPKRKSIESKEEVLLTTDKEKVGEVVEYLDI